MHLIDTPEVITTEPLLMAKIPVKISTSQIQTVMGPTLTELAEEIRLQGVEITGSWFTHHFHRPTEIFNFEVCFPVARPVEPSGRMEAGVWPAMRMARTIMHGGYERLVQAWPEFDRWIAANGHEPSPELWERYIVGPESGLTADAWRTELCRPLLQTPDAALEPQL